MARAASLIVLITSIAVTVIGCGDSRKDDAAAAAGAAPAGASARANAGTGGNAGQRAPAVDGVVLVTIDTLRADRVGAYGWRAARTPAIDALAARGVRADRAFATAPITLTSHASLLTGRYPPAHGARHNGMRLRTDVPTLAESLRARGFATGAFVSAFPLDRRFGLDRGFDVYSDALPRGLDGRPLNERPGRVTVDEALAWLAKNAAGSGAAASSGGGSGGGGGRFFLWVHLFEPHAPYESDPAFGASASTRSISDRYDDEIARADTQVARLVSALSARGASTLFIVAGDHGEAFGEHGEVGHSLFVYDTTLRVPLIFAGAGVDGGGVVAAAASATAAGTGAGAAVPAAIAGTGVAAARTDAGTGTRAAPAAVAGTGVAAARTGAGAGTAAAAGTGIRSAAAGAPAGVAAVAAASGRSITDVVSLVDVMPTVLELLGAQPLDGDGVSLVSALRAATDNTRGDSDSSARNDGSGRGSSAGGGAASGTSGGAVGARTLYAESFAPLLDFGWSPLRSLRIGDEKYIAAPKPELYDVARDAAESKNLLAERPAVAKSMSERVDRIAPADLPLATGSRSRSGSGAATATATASGVPAAPGTAAPDAAASPSAAAASASSASATHGDREAEARLRSLGYLAGSGATAAASASSIPASARPDPKDRVALASRIAEVTSGELQGAALRRTLEQIVRDDPRNGQMQMRLGFVLQESGACAAAIPHFEAAIAASLPSADPGLGLAECLGAAGHRDAARRALLAANRVEPGNPVVSANLGMMDLADGQIASAIDHLRATLAVAPDLHQARFALARAYARAGQRTDATREARELLARLPPDAPQRSEVERLLAAVQ